MNRFLSSLIFLVRSTPTILWYARRRRRMESERGREASDARRPAMTQWRNWLRSRCVILIETFSLSPCSQVVASHATMTNDLMAWKLSDDENYRHWEWESEVENWWQIERSLAQRMTEIAFNWRLLLRCFIAGNKFCFIFCYVNFFIKCYRADPLLW